MTSLKIGRRSAWAAILVIGVATLAHAAGKSDVADAVMRGDQTALSALLQQKAGANVNVTSREGVTPIAMAALYGDAAIIDALLKAGADAKAKTANGETLVMFAARNGNPDAIRVIVNAGADINAKENLRGTTALMWAVEQKH